MVTRKKLQTQLAPDLSEWPPTPQREGEDHMISGNLVAAGVTQAGRTSNRTLNSKLTDHHAGLVARGRELRSIRLRSDTGSPSEPRTASQETLPQVYGSKDRGNKSVTSGSPTEVMF